MRAANAGSWKGADEVLVALESFMNEMGMGQVTVGSRVRIDENVEEQRTRMFAYSSETSCHFWTGFLNGLWNTLFGKHVLEVRCSGAEDSFCEWRIS